MARLERDRERFSDLMARNRRAIVRYGLRRLDDPADVDDLVAETFVVAWRRFETCPSGSAELFWLYAIARRVLANQLRSQQRSTRLRGRLAAERDLERDEPRFSGEDIERLLSALGALRQEDRELIELAYFERLSYREIGLVVGCKEKAAGVRLARARTRLRELMQRDGAIDAASGGGSR